MTLSAHNSQVQCPHVNATCFFLDQQTQHILACSSIFSFRRFILSKFSSVQSIMVWILEKLCWLRREGYEWEGTHDWDDDYFGGRLF